MVEAKERMPGSVLITGSGNEIDVLLNGMIIDRPPTPRSYENFTEVWQNMTTDEKNFIGLDICIGFLGREEGTHLYMKILQASDH